MASSTMLLLAIFLVVTSKVFSHEEDLKSLANYVHPHDAAPSPAPPVKAPTPTTPVKSPSYPPGPVTTPSPATPPAKVPPPQSPTVKPPSPTPPQVKPPAPAPPVVYPPPPSPVVKSPKDCVPRCDNRCQLHSRKKLCLRACLTCCYRCKCVPPGTYGNREQCGKCYTDMLTHGNKFKCP